MCGSQNLNCKCASCARRLGERMQISFRLVRLQYDAPVNENQSGLVKGCL